MTPVVRLMAIIFVVFALDASVRPWKPLRVRARPTLAILIIAYAFIGMAAFCPPKVVVVAIALTGVFGLYSFGRMVGLTQHPAFFLSSLVSTLSFYVAATVHWYALFQAMPVYAVSLVAATGAMKADSRAFLQKLCLSWVGLLVFGYLLAHAVLFVDEDFRASLGGGAWLATSLGLARAADVAGAVMARLSSRAGASPIVKIAPLFAPPLGGAVGGLAVHAAIPAAMSAPHFIMLGVAVGAGLAIGGRAYTRIVEDVVGDNELSPRKGTLVFAGAFAVALAYHFVRYVS